MFTFIYTNGFIILLKNYKLDIALVKKIKRLTKYEFCNKTILQH